MFRTGKPQIMTFGEAPPNPEYELPEAAKGLVMHTRLMINGSDIMFSDTFPGSPFTVGMELQEIFWSKCYGRLTDKFEIEWQLSHENKRVIM